MNRTRWLDGEECPCSEWNRHSRSARCVEEEGSHRQHWPSGQRKGPPRFWRLIERHFNVVVRAISANADEHAAVFRATLD